MFELAEVYLYGSDRSLKSSLEDLFRRGHRRAPWHKSPERMSLGSLVQKTKSYEGTNPEQNIDWIALSHAANTNTWFNYGPVSAEITDKPRGTIHDKTPGKENSSQDQDTNS